MAEISVAQVNWAGGELSPKMRSRSDLPVYRNGAERMVNFISETAGPKRFRSGFQYAQNTHRHGVAWLLPFQFNDSDAYELEFTSNYIRFYRNDGIVTLANVTITGVTQAATAVVHAPSHGYSTGDEVIITGVVGMTQLNNRSFVITVNDSNYFQLNDAFGTAAINSSTFGAYVSGGVCNKIYEVKTPYLIADIPHLKISQNADVLYIDHNRYESRKLTRLASNSWTLALYTRTADHFTDKKTITVITKATHAQVTAVGHGYSTGQIVYIETVVGMTEINGLYSSITYVDADNFTLDSVDSTGFTTYDSAGYVSDCALLSSCLAFYQGRLYHAGSDKYPESFWGSKPLDSSGNPQYDDYTLGSNTADAFKFTLSPVSTKVDKIESLVPCLNFLAICTFEGISKATGSTDVAITPSSIDVTPVVTTGCLQQITPFLLGIVMMYVHRSALVLYSLEFDIFYNAYNAMDKNLTNDQWPQSGLTQMCYFVGRPSGFVFARNDGELIWLSYMVKENINAANRILIGGTLVKVLSVGVMPRVNKYDQLWIVSERLVNGKTCRFVEYQNDDPVIPERDDFWSGDDNAIVDDLAWRNAMFEAQKQYIYMDAALTYDGSDYGVNAAATLTPGGLKGNGVTFTAGAAVFDATMVGRQLWKQVQNGAGTGRAEIVAYTSSTQVVCNILTAFDSLAAMPAGEWYLTTDTVYGAWHLEGETVKVLADGGEHPEQVVTNGSITLEYQASVIHLGEGYTGFTRSMHLGSGTPQVPSDARKMNVNRLGVKFLNTLGARYGTDLYHMSDFEFSKASDLMGRPSPLFSEHLVVSVQDDSDYSKHIYIQQIRPLPCTVEDMVPFIEFDET